MTRQQTRVKPASRREVPTPQESTRILVVRTYLNLRGKEEPWVIDQELIDTAPEGVEIVTEGGIPRTAERYRKMLDNMSRQEGADGASVPVVSGPAVIYFQPAYSEEVPVEGERGGTERRDVPAHWAVLKVGDWDRRDRNWKQIEDWISKNRK